MLPKIVLPLLLLLLCASPVSGYVVFLKDGEQIQTQEKYRVEGDQAILILRSGVTSSIPLDEIDVEKTERENRINLGSSRVIEGMEDVAAVDAVPPPPPPETLADVLRRREDRGLRLPEPRKRKQETKNEEGWPRTAAGYIDLTRLRRVPPEDPEIAELIRRILVGQLETVNVYQGTVPKQPFVEIAAASEPQTFKALTETAAALLQIVDQHPDRIDGLEVLIVSEVKPTDPVRAGQFQLTPELAELLVDGRMSPPAFFLRYVEF